jgi:hypothetical protein
MGLTDRWRDCLTDGQTDRMADEATYGRINGQTDGEKERLTDSQTDR